MIVGWRSASLQVERVAAVSRLSESIARSLVLLAQKTPFKAAGGYSSRAFAAKGWADSFPQATREAGSFGDFFIFFRGQLTPELLSDKVVLDFGCGYGGRTVEYARQGHPRMAIGVEPVPAHIDLARAYAKSRDIDNVRFELCTQAEIPLPSASVDVVLSYDVLEHVADPRQSMQEIQRILTPGGRAYLVFPVYGGALAHHLDYVSRIPGIHWFFSPATLINAVNSILREDQDLVRFGTPVQPAPGRSFDGRRTVLPTLNGMTGEDFTSFAKSFETEYLYFRPLLAQRRYLGAPFRTLMQWRLPSRMRDAITTNVACILRKHAKSRDRESRVGVDN